MTAILLSSPPAQLFFMTPQPSIETGWSVGKPGAMQIQIRNRCSDFNSYRAARVKSLFNAESGCNFDLDADLDLSGEWSIGVVVGPSGSGKTSIGRQIFGDPAPFWTPEWPADAPIIHAIASEGDFNAVTGALGSVGLGSVPTWLRPYPVLSNGEKFRADLARLVCDAPERAIVDEFTSVVDRQSSARSPSPRHGGG